MLTTYFSDRLGRTVLADRLNAAETWAASIGLTFEHAGNVCCMYDADGRFVDSAEGTDARLTAAELALSAADHI